MGAVRGLSAISQEEHPAPSADSRTGNARCRSSAGGARGDQPSWPAKAGLRTQAGKTTSRRRGFLNGLLSIERTMEGDGESTCIFKLNLKSSRLILSLDSSCCYDTVYTLANSDDERMAPAS